MHFIIVSKPSPNKSLPQNDCRQGCFITAGFTVGMDALFTITDHERHV